MTGLETIRQAIANKLAFLFENYILTTLAFLVLAFCFMHIYVPGHILLLILNSLYLGCIVSTVIIYGYFFIYTVFNMSEWGRDRQFTLSVGLQHLSYILVVVYSASYRTPVADPDLPVSWTLLLSRYVAIVATTLQVFSPDMGESLFYGLNRKVLLAGFFFGALIAFFVLFVQLNPALAAALGI